MNYAVLYNVFLCWMVGLISLAATRAVLMRPKPSVALRALGLSWLFAALLWFLTGLRLLAYFTYLVNGKAGLLVLDRLIFYTGEIFLAGQTVSIIFFAAHSVWRNRKVTLVLAWLSLVSAASFLVLLYWLGVADYLETPWGSEHVLSPAAFYAFLPGYSLSLCLVVSVIMKGGLRRWRGVSGPGRAETLSAIAILLYGVAGVFDVRGSWGGWELLLIRVSYLVAALITFWAARPEDNSIRVVRRLEEP